MDRSFLRRALLADSDRLLEYLLQRQHVLPHASIESVLQQMAETQGIGTTAMHHALAWLQVDTKQPIGRLRRTELTQLARSIHRFWRQSAVQQAATH